MNDITTGSLAQNQEAETAPAAASTLLVVIAWISTLLLSKFPLVIAREFLGGDIPGITAAWIVTATLLIVVTFAWPALKPLRRYFAILGVIYLVTLIDPFLRQLPVLRPWIESGTRMLSLFADRIILLVHTVIVLGVLLLMGVRRPEAFLTVGDLRAPVDSNGSPARKRRLTWAVLGPLVSLGLGGLYFLFLSGQNQAGLSNFTAALPWIPLILLSAAMNAFSEEARFRAAPLAALLPAVGPSHALWLTSLWFGLGHYYDASPSGPFGMVQTGLLALLMGRAMLDTRGMGWPWFIHLVIDIVIFVFMAAAIV